MLVNGKPLTLSPLEFRVLRLLLERKGRVVEREEFFERVWGDETEVSERAIDTLVRRLRLRLGDASSRIETIRGVGYRILED